MKHGPYVFAGLQIASELELPELLLDKAHRANDPDVVITMVIGPVGSTHAFTVDADGTSHLQVENLAMYEISPSSRHVAVTAAPDAAALMVRTFLYGSVFALLLFRRGLLPLHGACLEVGGAAVILSGESGAGKSTLALSLMRRGHPVLSDDLCGLDVSGPLALVLPSFPRLKLLDDAVAHFQLEQPAETAPARAGEKGHFRFAGAASYTGPPLRLKAVVSLEVSASPEIVVSPLPTMAALAFLRSQVHRARMGAAIGMNQPIFRAVCAVAAKSPVYRLRRPLDLNRLEETAESIERLMESLA